MPARMPNIKINTKQMLACMFGMWTLAQWYMMNLMQTGTFTVENHVEVPQKAWNASTAWSSCIPFGHTPKDSASYYGDTHSSLVIADLFLVARKWKKKGLNRLGMRGQGKAYREGYLTVRKKKKPCGSLLLQKLLKIYVQARIKGV